MSGAEVAAGEMVLVEEEKVAAVTPAYRVV